MTFSVPRTFKIVFVLAGSSVIASMTPGLAYSQETTRPAVTENAIGISPDEANWIPCPAGSPKGCEIAVLFGDMANGSSHILYRIPAGSAPFPKFWHSSSEHGVMIQGKLTGKGDNGEDFGFDKGTYWYIPAGLIHGGVRCSDEESCIWYEFFDKPWDSNVVAEGVGEAENK